MLKLDVLVVIAFGKVIDNRVSLVSGKLAHSLQLVGPAIPVDSLSTLTLVQIVAQHRHSLLRGLISVVNLVQLISLADQSLDVPQHTIDLVVLFCDL